MEASSMCGDFSSIVYDSVMKRPCAMRLSVAAIHVA